MRPALGVSDPRCHLGGFCHVQGRPLVLPRHQNWSPHGTTAKSILHSPRNRVPLGLHHRRHWRLGHGRQTGYRHRHIPRCLWRREGLRQDHDLTDGHAAPLSPRRHRPTVIKLQRIKPENAQDWCYVTEPADGVEVSIADLLISGQDVAAVRRRI